MNVSSSSFALLERTRIPAAAGPFVGKALMLDQLDGLCDGLVEPSINPRFFSQLLDRLGVTCECDQTAHIPADGPAVLVCNHPFGLIEGPILGSLLEKVRPDFKFMANSLLMSVPQLRRHVIPVDPFGGGKAVRSNLRPLRESMQWVRDGGLLVVFPAGEVSALDLQQRRISEPAWNEAVVRIIEAGHASAVPVFFHGVNSPAFHISGLVHPRLRTALLPRELFNKRGKNIRVSIAKPVSHERLAAMESPLQYLRWRTELMGEHAKSDSPPSRRCAPIAPPGDADQMKAEIARLTPILSNSEFSVFLATSTEVPETLKEIGRLREISFRQAGEGTGNARDLDRFDSHYEHLFLWNHANHELVGAYRLAGTDQILACLGARGLYTHTLFEFQPGFLKGLGPALELGRSFIRAEYQKNYQSLLMLWKGIGRVVAQRPRYRYLFGPVSISNSYRPASRELMATFLTARHRDESLARSVTPRHPFRPDKRGVTGITSSLADIDELSQVIADLEPDHKGVPVLVRQYLNLGGQILGFNVDNEFSNVVDGLIVVDLLKLTPKLLDRYLGPDGARNLLAWHRPAA